VVGELRVFFDGRDPQLKGVSLPLPRRERRILEYLVNNRGRRVSKAQIFNSIYGIFDEDVEENVVESHISKLRKKLRCQLGYDPINSVRYLGYRLDESISGADADGARQANLPVPVRRGAAASLPKVARKCLIKRGDGFGLVRFVRKYARSRNSEIPAIGAIAGICPAWFGSAVSDHRRLPICSVFLFAKARHDQLDVTGHSLPYMGEISICLLCVAR